MFTSYVKSDLKNRKNVDYLLSGVHLSSLSFPGKEKATANKQNTITKVFIAILVLLIDKN